MRGGNSPGSAHVNRSLVSRRTNRDFIPATGLAPHGLAGCRTAVPWQASAPLLQSPRGEPFGPSVTLATYYALCRLLSTGRLGSRLAQFAWDHSLAQTDRQISRGKTQNVPRVDAGFIKHAPREDGGLRGHVPARPERATPQIRFVYLAPRFWIGLPSDPASRRRPCPSPSLRLLLYLASGLPPDQFCAMPGTHA